MIQRFKSLLKSHSAWSLYGQCSYLLANFTLFLVLIRHYPLEQFGNWALYITLIAIIDSLRQGLIQNGLIRLLVQKKAETDKLISSALLINYGFIVIIGLLLWITGQYAQGIIQNTALSELLLHSFKSLLALSSLQFINVLCISRQDFKGYFINNFIYGTCLLVGLLMLSFSGNLSFVAIINLQVIAVVPCILFAVSTGSLNLVWPERKSVMELLNFGKYVAGTNILSMLFHKADLLMLAIFTDPAAVALFHFATKIVGYSELPLNALSQVIYPRLAVSHRHRDVSHLKITYVDSVLRLLLLAIPLSLGIIMFRETIISLLSSGYQSASTLIIILCLGGLFKPVGRVFGLTLDAIGRPRINFQMLSFSLIVNVIMNSLLIPPYGTTGAALATAISIALTVIWGQVRLRNWVSISSDDLILGFKNLSNHSFFTKTKLA